MNNCKDIDQKLEILYDLLVDNFGVLETELKTLIANPEKIENTNKFASLISDLKKPVFIEPLLYSINLGKKGDTWLCDFLYAAINLLKDTPKDYEFESPENLVDKLAVWLLDGTGELAWKSAGLLKFCQSKQVEKIFLKKLEQREDFFLTYSECIIGLLWYDKKKHLELVREIAKDPTRDEKLRELCLSTTKE